jgi:hypothetical protein
VSGARSGFLTSLPKLCAINSSAFTWIGFLGGPVQGGAHHRPAPVAERECPPACKAEDAANEPGTAAHAAAPTPEVG